MSFAFPEGIPSEASMVFNARFLKPPMVIMDLQKLTGLDKEVQEYLETDDDLKYMLQLMKDMIMTFIPRYKKRYKDSVVIAIGCTGGQHRSVYVAEKLSLFFKETGYTVQTKHREIHRYLINGII